MTTRARMSLCRSLRVADPALHGLSAQVKHLADHLDADSGIVQVANMVGDRERFDWWVIERVE